MPILKFFSGNLDHIKDFPRTRRTLFLNDFFSQDLPISRVSDCDFLEVFSHDLPRTIWTTRNYFLMIFFQDCRISRASNWDFKGFFYQDLQTNKCGFLNNFSIVSGVHILKYFQRTTRPKKMDFFSRASRWDSRTSHRTSRDTVDNCSWICLLLFSHKCVIFARLSELLSVTSLKIFY